MDTFIADLTNQMIDDLKFEELEVNKETMMCWLNEQYIRHLPFVQYSETPGRTMNFLVAIKHMIDTLSYNPL